MAFPITGILDDCNRVDESPLSDGGKWATRNTNDDLRLETQLIRGQTVGVLASNYWADSAFGPDCEAYYTVNHTPNTATDYIRIYARLSSPGQAGETGYLMQWANSGGVMILKETARESFTGLASDAAQTYTTNDVVGVSLVGSTITVYKNGVSVLTVGDGSFTSAGNIGIGGRGTSFRLDDVGGGTIAQVSQVLAMQTHIMGHGYW